MALDPNLFFYSEGTITLTNGSDLATGDTVAWDPAVLPFDFIFPNNGQDGMSVVKEVLSVNQIRLAKPWTGPTLTAVPYFMVRWVRHTDPRVYALRVSDYLTRLKAIPDNIEEVAADINADAATVAAAMTLLSQIETNVDADRQAAQTAAGTATGAASAAASSATMAQQWAEAASSGVLPDNGVTNVKLADVPTATIKGRVDAGTGDPTDLTPAQVRSLIGTVWTPLQTIVLTTTQPLIIIDIPAGINVLRISGYVFATDNTSHLFMRISRDGGATYISSSSYTNNFIIQSASAGVSAVAHATETVAAFYRLSNASNGANIPIIFETLFQRGSPTTYPTHSTRAAGFVASAGGNVGVLGGYVTSVGAADKVAIGMTTANMGIGTKMIVEGA